MLVLLVAVDVVALLLLLLLPPLLLWPCDGGEVVLPMAIMGGALVLDRRDDTCWNSPGMGSRDRLLVCWRCTSKRPSYWVKRTSESVLDRRRW